MSCNIVNDDTLNVLLTYLERLCEKRHMPIGRLLYDFDPGSGLNEVGDILRRANYESVNNRYDENKTPEPFKFKRYEEKPEYLTAPVILKLCDYYDYQTCEMPGYSKSKAYEIIRQIGTSAIRDVEGYEQAPWGI